MPDYATLYISDPGLIGSRLFKRMEEISDVESLSEKGRATGFKFKFGKTSIQCNLMPTGEIKKHLSEFENYAKTTWDGTEDDLIYFLSRLTNVAQSLGCVIEPGFDEDGEVANFLVRFNSQFNGLMFIMDSIVDLDGTTLSGPLKENESQ